MTRTHEGRYSRIKEAPNRMSEPRWVVRYNGQRLGESFSKKVADGMIEIHQRMMAEQADSVKAAANLSAEGLVEAAAHAKELEKL